MTKALVLTLTACAPSGPETAPEWINEPAVAHPEAMYFAAVGSGQNLDQAADIAFARLAQRVEVEVKAREVSESTYVGETDRTGTRGTESVRLDRTIDLSSRVRLPAATIQESWRDRETGLTWALAVLDRGAAARSYSADMAALSGQVRTQRSLADTGSAWNGFVRLGKALALAQEHDRAARMYEVLDPFAGPAGRGAARLVPDVVMAREAARTGIAARIEPGPHTPPEFERAVRNALLAAGVPVGGDDPPALLARITYEAHQRPFYTRRDCVIEWRLLLELEDTQADRVVDAVRLEGDGWGLDCDAASEAALHRARESTNTELPRRLADLIGPPPNVPLGRPLEANTLQQG
ncbi:MAG: LPP20 family lipoprotein [Planctomycetota bacterium]|jgi:hypothetical protein